MNILFIGDIVGNLGRKIIKERLTALKKEYEIDFCIANGENSAGGNGITHVIAQELYENGVDIITLGNHTWSKKEILNFIDDDNNIVRPANYPPDVPGKGFAIIDGDRGKIGVINALGRVYMESLDCPFKSVDRDLQYIKKFVNIVILDIHAEATSEKAAIGWYFDGKVSAVLGTHTHVQTSDERILPQGTGFITDVGMTGPYDGIIGVTRDIIVKKFINHMPIKFDTEIGVGQLNGVVLKIDDNTGKTLKITRIYKTF